MAILVFRTWYFLKFPSTGGEPMPANIWQKLFVWLSFLPNFDVFVADNKPIDYGQSDNNATILSKSFSATPSLHIYSNCFCCFGEIGKQIWRGHWWSWYNAKSGTRFLSINHYAIKTKLYLQYPKKSFWVTTKKDPVDCDQVEYPACMFHFFTTLGACDRIFDKNFKFFT